MSSPQLNLLSIGTPAPLKPHHEHFVSAIIKKPVEKTFLSKEGFRGDSVANTTFHGGPDRAVCFYSAEHYETWEQEFHVTLPRPAFGENLMVSNMLEKDVCIGDIYQIGEATVQITQGRIPCDTITKRTGINGLLKRIVDTGYTGFLARVIKEGNVTREAPITLIKKDPAGISILDANRIYFHEQDNKEGIKKILEVDALAEAWRVKLKKRLSI